MIILFQKNQKGFAIIQIVIAVLAALAIIIGGFFAIKFLARPAEKEGTVPTAEERVTEKAIEDLSAPAPAFDFSVSPIKDIKLSTFNLNPTLPGNVFSNLSLDTKISYTGTISLSSPTVSLTAPMNFNIKTSTEQPSNNVNTNVNVNTNTNTAPSIDCSQFSTVPSCSYVGALGSSAYESCKQCYPDK